MSKILLSKIKLDELYRETITLAAYAKNMQKDIIRYYKEDGSVLTKTDTEISKRIIEKVNTLFPECNIISEENITPFNREAPFTFILDPIDGTDIYSQGLPSFAISIGILNKEREAVGAIIIAPRFGIGKEELRVRLDPYKDLYIDDMPYNNIQLSDFPKQITISSKLQKQINFDNYKGKFRTFGSSILQILAPAIFSNISGCINQRAFAWDIASSHAVLNKLNIKMVYPNKEEIIYDDDLLINRKLTKDIIYCGSEKGIDILIETLPQKVKN
ncbi:MAG: inositol monophosphatase family protein [Pleomorphochaeta sp.]